MTVAKKPRVNNIVLDSSAVLALVYDEPGAAKVIAELQSGSVEPLVSAVDLCEVHTRLLRDGLPANEISKLLSNLEMTVVPFSEADAYGASTLYPETKAFGLSLGDRACLALAMKQRVTVWTADKVWKRLKLDVAVELVRI